MALDGDMILQMALRETISNSENNKRRPEGARKGTGRETKGARIRPDSQ